MTKNISQREARAMRAELKRIRERDERRNNRWSSFYPGGVNITSWNLPAEGMGAIRTALLLGHAVVCKVERDTVHFYGIKP